MNAATFDRVDGDTVFDDVFGKGVSQAQFEDSHQPDLFVNLIPGAPNPPDLRRAMRLMQDGTQTLTSSEYATNANILQYGAKLGSARFRRELANFLSDEYGDSVCPKNLMVTSGASSGLVLVTASMLSPGSTVFVEDPTYYLAIDMFRNEFQLNVIGVPTDNNGMQVDVLEALLEEHVGGQSYTSTSQRPFQCMVYVIPTYNNPTGACLSPERSEKIVQLARKFEALVVCDDVYNLLHFSGESSAPVRLKSYDRSSDPGFKGHVISNGSFSKIFAPGVRLGWIEAGDRLMYFFFERKILHSGGSANHFISEIMAEIMAKGLLREHLKALRLQYASTARDISSIFKTNLPSSVVVKELKGGYFFWVELPKDRNANRVAQLAMEKYSVMVLPGERCSILGGYQNFLRVAFTFNEKAVVIRAMSGLCSAIKDHLDEVVANPQGQQANGGPG